MSKRNYPFLALLAGIAIASSTAIASAAPVVGGISAGISGSVNAGVNAGGINAGINGGVNAAPSTGQSPVGVPSSVQPPVSMPKAPALTEAGKAAAQRGYQAVVTALTGNSVTIKTSGGVVQTFTLANPAALKLKPGDDVLVAMRKGTLVMMHASSSNVARASVQAPQRKHTGSQSQH